MVAELDLKDRKILYELDLNARQNDSQIAKKVGLSRDSVRYRINRLVEKGYIKKFITLINTMKLGFDWYRTFFKFQNLTLEKEKEIVKWLERNVSWAVKVEGKWDLNTGIFARDVYGFENVLNEFLLKFNKYISGFETSIVTRMWHHHREYLLDVKKSARAEIMGFTEGEKRKTEEIDKMDYQILEALLENARMKTVDIADKVGTTEIVVRYRIKKLIEKGVIIGFRALLDMERLGYSYFKLHLTLQNYSKEEKEKIFSYLMNHHNTAYTTELVGGANIETEFQVRGNEEFYKEIEKLRKLFGKNIRDYESMQYTKEYKFTYLPKMNFQ